jgi:hypothetical protein
VAGIIKALREIEDKVFVVDRHINFRVDGESKRLHFDAAGDNEIKTASDTGKK